MKPTSYQLDDHAEAQSGFEPESSGYEPDMKPNFTTALCQYSTLAMCLQVFWNISWLNVYPTFMDSTTIAYMAGLMDGEGSITLVKNYGSSNPELYRFPYVSVASTTFELVQFCKDNFGGSISTKKVYQDHHKPSYAWALQSRQAVELLDILVPYMLEPEKIRRAQLVIAFQRIKPRNGRYTPELVEQLKQITIDFFS